MMAINVSELGDAVYSDLRRLARRPYLAAMWILCDELRSLYTPEISEPEQALMTATLELARGAVIAGEGPEVAARATELGGAWDRLRDELREDDDTTTGQAYAWATFHGLAQELAGTAGFADQAVEAVTGAVVERRADSESSPTWINDPGEEVDDADPIGRTLMLFHQAVRGVAAAGDELGDPQQVRQRILDR
jgi:hypothetical protein